MRGRPDVILGGLTGQHLPIRLLALANFEGPRIDRTAAVDQRVAVDVHFACAIAGRSHAAGIKGTLVMAHCGAPGVVELFQGR